MKKITEKDLSLDKQAVSNLSGGTDNRDETNNELICASKVCTQSHFEICCVVSVEETCPEQCPQVKTVDICPYSKDTLCEDCTNYETCICPVTEIQRC